MRLKNMETIIQHLENIIPIGSLCFGCPKAWPPIKRGPWVYCEMMEEVRPQGEKACDINKGTSC